MRRTSEKGAVVSNRGCVARLGDSVMTHEERTAHQPDDAMESGGVLTPDDFEAIERFHAEFILRGLDLRFATFGRPPGPHYPTCRQLVLETDATGELASWLSEFPGYCATQTLQSIATLLTDDLSSYWDLVTRDVLPLR